jgi:hypothetical protein
MREFSYRELRAVAIVTGLQRKLFPAKYHSNILPGNSLAQGLPYTADNTPVGLCADCGCAVLAPSKNRNSTCFPRKATGNASENLSGALGARCVEFSRELKIRVPAGVRFRADASSPGTALY